MKDLIEALTILLKYMIDPDNRWPTACEHDIMFVWGVDIKKVTVEDVRKLSTLGFMPGFDHVDFEYVDRTLGHDFAIEGTFEDVTPNNGIWSRATSATASTPTDTAAANPNHKGQKK